MSHYFTNDINLKHNVDKKNVVINGKEFTFFTDNGVFSKKGLDFGTRTLLESLPEDLKGDISFEKVGHKRLMAKFAGLEIME